MSRILIVYHSQSGVVEKMAYAVKKGIARVKGVEAVLKKAEDATWDDLKDSAGIAVGTPDYFDYMAGTVKDFFDRTFYPSQSRTKGSLTADMPCVFFVSGGAGGGPAIESLKKIAKSFKFNVIDSVSGRAALHDALLLKCEDLGEKIAIHVSER